MAFKAKDGSMHTNHDSMMRADARFGAKPAAMSEPEDEPDGDEAPEPHHAAIHEHLAAMHAETGEAHSHVEHHGDGTHTSHHVTANGEVTGPHHHPDTESMKQKMEEMAGEPQEEPVEEGY